MRLGRSSEATLKRGGHTHATLLNEPLCHNNTNACCFFFSLVCVFLQCQLVSCLFRVSVKPVRCVDANNFWKIKKPKRNARCLAFVQLTISLWLPKHRSIVPSCFLCILLQYDLIQHFLFDVVLERNIKAQLRTWELKWSDRFCYLKVLNGQACDWWRISLVTSEQLPSHWVPQPRYFKIPSSNC